MLRGMTTDETSSASSSKQRNAIASTLMERVGVAGLCAVVAMLVLPGAVQGFFYRPGANRWPPVPVYRTGWTGYRLKPVKLKFEFKTRSYTGYERLTGRLDRFTGPV